MAERKTPEFLKAIERNIRNTELVSRLRKKKKEKRKKLHQSSGYSHVKIEDFEIQSGHRVYFEKESHLYFTPHFNILIPSLLLANMSGGPNTILAFGAHLAVKGFRIRFISTTAGCESDKSILINHIQNISDMAFDTDLIAFVDGHKSKKNPVRVGYRDRYMATAWWTFDDAKTAAAQSEENLPYYFIQDFEEVFYDGSALQARCRASYLTPHHAIYNSSVLKDFYDNHFYIYPEDDKRASSQFFQPTIPENAFYPCVKQGSIKILFYARPENARRNLYDVGIKALEYLSETGFLKSQDVDVFSIGEKIKDVDLGGGKTLVNIPWKNYDAYAEMVRSHDIVLSLMWAPHPSYLPLEAAHCGNLAVTTSYINKRQSTFDAWGLDIQATDASVEGVATALQKAIHIATTRRLGPSRVQPRAFPSQWQDSFQDITVEMPSSHKERSEA